MTPPQVTEPHQSSPPPLRPRSGFLLPPPRCPCALPLLPPRRPRPHQRHCPPWYNAQERKYVDDHGCRETDHPLASLEPRPPAGRRRPCQSPPALISHLLENPSAIPVHRIKMFCRTRWGIHISKHPRVCEATQTHMVPCRCMRLETYLLLTTIVPWPVLASTRPGASRSRRLRGRSISENLAPHGCVQTGHGIWLSLSNCQSSLSFPRIADATYTMGSWKSTYPGTFLGQLRPSEPSLGQIRGLSRRPGALPPPLLSIEQHPC